MPKVHETIDAEGNPTDSHMVPGAEKHLAELEFYAKALKQAREAEKAASN